MTAVAVIGGSGLYELQGLSDVQEHKIDTPFGPPSDLITEGNLGGTRMLFLSRHGKGHRFIPTDVNYRANIFALKKLGAERVISVSAVGSMREEIRPGDMVIVDQFVDRTKGRASTFFGGGIAGHVVFADPTCPELSKCLYDAAVSSNTTIHNGGTLMVMEGPAFSTRAESRMHRQLGVDMIGMTAMPEAKLAREAELCYATLALATDYDCWHESEEDVSVDAVISILRRQHKTAKAILEKTVRSLPPKRACACATSLDTAVITDKKLIPAQTLEMMRPVFGRVL
jgi:5'-methylthioadenosine phosphorylase